MNLSRTPVWALLIAGCHGSPVPAGQATPHASASQHSLRTVAMHDADAAVKDAAPPDATPPEVATLDAAPPEASSPNDEVLSVVHDARSWLDDSDVAFHVTNDTGADVFIDDEHSLSLELRGKPVILNPGCGSHCPSCACKECPYEPPRVRRIPNRGTWLDRWDRRIHVSQHCGGACPCIRDIHAQPGTYTATLSGKRRADAPPSGKALVYAGRLDENSADCTAEASFRMKPGAQVALNLSCKQ